MGSSVVGSGAGTAYTQWVQTIDGTARAFSTNNIEPNSADTTTWAKRVVVNAEGGWMRLRWSDLTTAPTTTAGHPFTSGDVLILEGHANIKQFQAIAFSNLVPGTLQVTAER